MNDHANTKEWEKGDVVIHDADAKKEYMLMVVVGEAGGEYLTRYLQPHRAAGYGSPQDHRWESADAGIRSLWKQIWRNFGAVLHDPRRFKIEIPDNPDLSHCPELQESSVK